MRIARPPGSQGPGKVAGPVVKAMQLALARRAGGLLPGEHIGRGTGTGLELAQLRPYEPGDDVRRIDAAATARTGTPHVRLEVPERLLTTWVVVDLSPSMAFGTADRLKSDVAQGAAQVLARVATRRGGRVGVVVAGVSGMPVSRPRGGRLGCVAVDRALADGVASDGSRAEALDAALRRVAGLARQPGLVAVASDFRGEPGWQRALRRLGSRHALLCAEIVDPREEALPDVGRVTLVDPETGQLADADTSDIGLRRRYAEAERLRRLAVRTAIRSAGARHAPLSTAGAWSRELARAVA